MAMLTPHPQDEAEVIASINTTPLVDVMLVLLIIFLITIPVVTTSVRVNLPRETHQVRQTQPDNVILSVDKNGRVFLYDRPLGTTQDLLVHMQNFARMRPQPQVHIRGDRASDFAAVGRVLYAVQRAGMSKVSFITEPQPR